MGKTTKKEVVIVEHPHLGPLAGFALFVREQGVVGLAVGLVLGSAVKSLVDSLVTNIVNPVLGVLLGGANLANRGFCIQYSAADTCSANVSWGAFLSSGISFVVISAIVYFVVHGFKLDKLDIGKEDLTVGMKRGMAANKSGNK